MSQFTREYRRLDTGLSTTLKNASISGTQADGELLVLLTEYNPNKIGEWASLTASRGHFESEFDKQRAITSYVETIEKLALLAKQSKQTEDYTILEELEMQEIAKEFADTNNTEPVSYTHLRDNETDSYIV